MAFSKDSITKENDVCSSPSRFDGLSFTDVHFLFVHIMKLKSGEIKILFILLSSVYVQTLIIAVGRSLKLLL